MTVRIVGLIAALWSSAAAAGTDFGVRTLGDGPATVKPLGATSATFSLAAAASMVQRFGVVTSMRRSVEHNRRVGGVHNSFHVSGRAIDIARRPGIRHHQIEQALRLAGFMLIESLDEGDHSHFAFAVRPMHRKAVSPTPAEIASATPWRVVLAPR